MSAKRNFSVAAIGICENEQQVLKSIFRLSSYRTRSYVLVKSLSDAEIVLIDADDEENIANYRTLSDLNPRQHAVPMIMVTTSPTSSSYKYLIRRPFIATRVLSALDQVAIKELSFVPELVIGDNTKLSNSVKEVLQENLESESKKRNYKALVVDDSIAVRKLMELELRRLDIQGDFAEDAATAFQMLNDNTYDIIFLDIVLPDVDGYKICKNIKKNKATKKTPVLMLTGKSSPFDRVKGKFAGCNNYLTKPTPSAILQNAIKQYLPINTKDGEPRKDGDLPNRDKLAQMAELS